MTITITITTDNAAFGDNPHDESAELSRILGDISAAIGRFGLASGDVRDINGNTCGYVKVKP